MKQNINTFSDIQSSDSLDFSKYFDNENKYL